MSRNKYKNNDSLNKKIKKPLDDETEAVLLDGEDETGANDRSSARAPGPGASDPSREHIEEPRERTIGDRSFANEDEAIPEDVQREVMDPSRERDRFQRMDVWDNAQTKVRSTTDLYETDHSSHGGIGEFKEQLSTDGAPREKITEVTDPDSGTAHGTAPAPRKGFPWWWILLPLIILGLIWGLTREPKDADTTPESSTSQLPVKMILAKVPDHFQAMEIL